MGNVSIDGSVTNQGGVPLVFAAAFANFPVAGIPFRIGFRTDSPYGVYMDTGSAFVLIADGGIPLGITAVVPIFYDSLTGVISSQPADAIQPGYLLAADWVTFNDKLSPGDLSATSPLFYDSLTGVISSQAASDSVSGYVTTGVQIFSDGKSFTNKIRVKTLNYGYSFHMPLDNPLLNLRRDDAFSTILQSWDNVGNTIVVGSVTAGNAKFGTWSFNSDYVRFGSISFDLSSNYGFLQRNNGEVYISGPSINVINPLLLTYQSGSPTAGFVLNVSSGRFTQMDFSNAGIVKANLYYDNQYSVMNYWSTGVHNFVQKVIMPSIQITSGANNGYVLTSDSLGNAVWSSVASGMSYKGAWNASTNTPTLADGVGTNGDMYAVSVGGVQFGRTFVAGGFAIYNGSIWEPVGTSAAVTSVNSLSGTVQINPSIIGDIISLTGGTATADISGATSIINKLPLAGGSLTGTLNAVDIIASGAVSALSLVSDRVGSNTVGAGPFLQLGSVVNNRFWVDQMNASFNRDFWYYDGSSWSIKHIFYGNGNFVALGNITGANLSGTNTGDQDLSAYAPLASPALTGTPTSTTPSPGDNSTKIATTAFVSGSLSDAGGYGTYTPTITLGTNAASSTAYLNKYTRNGNIVTVYGRALITFTSAINTAFTVSLPIPTNMFDSNTLVGDGSMDENGTGVHIDGALPANTANVRFLATAPLSGGFVYYSFRYEILP